MFCSSMRRRRTHIAAFTALILVCPAAASAQGDSDSAGRGADAQKPVLVPPRLVTADMVKSMKPGSVLVDLAIERGGNVEGAKANEVVDTDGIKIVGYTNVAGRVEIGRAHV